MEISTAERLQSFPLSNDEHVLVITGGTYHSYAFKTNDTIIIYDTPQDSERSLAMLNIIHETFPGLPIEFVLLSHNHFDHRGGFRGALSEGADLIVGESAVDFVNDLLTRSVTINENPLNSALSVIGIDTSLTFGSGSEELITYVVNSVHSEDDDMLFFYKPSTKTLFFPDLYNSGFTFVQKITQGSDTALLIKQRAQSLVDIVNQLGLDVVSIAPTHGGKYPSKINLTFYLSFLPF